MNFVLKTMTFYRKYRPQTINELDSVAVQTQVKQIVSTGSIPHALLLTGPKGTGKTSTARIIAKILNCERLAFSVQGLGKKEEKNKTKDLNPIPYTLNPDIEPCNECQSCISITGGNNLDVMEIDAASNRGIDEIRILREGIKLSPVQSKNKVFIIDEVHMLTNEAFNALLKTLEEPPSHAYFILATTDVDRVPDTIRSRSFGIQFSKSTIEETIRALKRVAEKETIEIDNDSLRLLAEYADGAFRDGVKVLEQVALASGGIPITKKHIETILGVHTSSMDEWIRIISSKDTQKILSFLQDLHARGVHIQGFIKHTIDSLHEEFLARFGVGNSSKRSELTDDDLITLMHVLSTASIASKSAVIELLPLELALVQWAETKGPEEPKGPKETNETKASDGPKGLNEIKEPDGPKETKGPNVPKVSTIQEEMKASNSTLNWSAFISSVQAQNHALAAILRSCKQLTSSDGEVIIGAQYQFHFDKLKDPKTHEILVKVVEEFIGKKIKVTIEFIKH